MLDPAQQFDAEAGWKWRILLDNSGPLLARGC